MLIWESGGLGFGSASKLHANPESFPSVFKFKTFRSALYEYKYLSQKHVGIPVIFQDEPHY